MQSLLCTAHITFISEYSPRIDSCGFLNRIPEPPKLILAAGAYRTANASCRRNEIGHMCLIFLFMRCPAKSIRGNGLFSSIGAVGFLHPGMQHAPGNAQCILDCGSIEKQYLCLSSFHFEVPYSQDVDTSLADCTVSQD